MFIRRFGCGSARAGRLAEGCEICMRGAKMVLLVTGRCGAGCFYCPLSAEKAGRDVIFANEARVSSLEEIIPEAEAIGAEGTGITGGDPLLAMDRTLEAIGILRDRFGEGHHIHLYTAILDPERAADLAAAGLDELRLHPPPGSWADPPENAIGAVARAAGIPVGIEVPAIPGMAAELRSLAAAAQRAGAAFMNLNELEFSEGNWGAMASRGFAPRSDESAAALGSEEAALEAMRSNRGMRMHFCSSPFKDGVQLRRRLTRRALRTSREYEDVTRDGTILRGEVYAADLAEARSALLSLGVPGALARENPAKGCVETSPRALRRLAGRLPYECFVVEAYPTADGLEVEKTPLRGK